MICVLLPVFHLAGPVFVWQRPLPLALLHLWAGIDVFWLLHHPPRV